MLCLLDLDGVVWLGGRPVPDSARAVERMRDAGHRVVFLTNNSAATVGDYVARLARAGVRAEPDELVSSAQAGAALVEPGQRVSVVGGAGIHEALAARGATVVDAGDAPEVVVVGRTDDLNAAELAAVASAVREGARFVATNADATYPTDHGLLPGAGALMAYLQVASGVAPEVAGKPHRAMVDLVRSRHGQPDVMVGDSPDTDGLFARAAGARFALVLSGVTAAGDLPVDPAPDLVGDDLSAVVDQLLS